MHRRAQMLIILLLAATTAASAQTVGPGVGGGGGSSSSSSFNRGGAHRPPEDGPDLYAIRYDVRYDEETWDRRFVTDRLWEQTLEDRPVTGPCRIGGRVFVAFHGRSVRAYDMEDGSTVWIVEVPGDVAGELAEASGDVALTTLQGDAIRLRASDGSSTFRAHLAQEIRTAPTMAGGLMLVAGRDDTVYALDAKTGQVRWKAPTGGKGLTSVVVSEKEELALVGDDSGTLHALSLKDGSVRWRYEGGSTITTAPAVSDRRAYVVSADRRLQAVALDDGDRKWRHRLGAGAAAAPVVVEDLVIVATLDNLISAYDEGNGFRKWRSPLPRRVTGSLRVEGGVVYATPTAWTEALAFMAKSGYELGRARLKSSTDHTVGDAAAGNGEIVMATYGRTLAAFREVTSKQVEDGEAELPVADRDEQSIDLSSLGAAAGLGSVGAR